MSPFDAKYALLSIPVDDRDFAINHPAALEYALLEELSPDHPSVAANPHACRRFGRLTRGFGPAIWQ